MQYACVGPFACVMPEGRRSCNLLFSKKLCVHYAKPCYLHPPATGMRSFQSREKLEAASRDRWERTSDPSADGFRIGNTDDAHESQNLRRWLGQARTSRTTT